MKDFNYSMHRRLVYMAYLNRFALFALTLLIFAACDRPFVAPLEPDISIVKPEDPAALQFSQFVEVQIEANSFREVARVEIDGQELLFDSTNGSWQTVVTLKPGINNLEVTAFDIDDFPGTQTLTLTHLKPQYISGAPALPAPWRLGGHTATLLEDGSVLAAGGAPGASQSAVQRAFILRPNDEEFSALASNLNAPRFGHSANLLPDGRVLILGGSVTAAATNAAQLVQSAEIFDPATGEFSVIEFTDDPLIRMEHVAFITQGPSSLIIDVYGGLGNDPSSNSGRLITSGDIRTYRFINDTLSPLSNFSDNQIQPGHGIASTLVSEPSSATMGRYVVSGANFLETGPENINFSIDFDQAPIQVNVLGEMRNPRTQHASAALEPGLVGFFGGFQGAPQSAASSAEIYVEANNRFSTLDGQVVTTRRFSHTATKLPSGRILILGGFSPTSEAISASEYFVWGL
ncbi:MAG: hypothetical protein AB8G77_09435 [Rhodothermales bacterium]